MDRPILFGTAKLIAAILLFSADEVRAEPLTFLFEGYIDTLVDIDLDESVTIGTPFFGSYSFDPAGVEDYYPDDPAVAFYGFVPPSNLTVTVGNY